MEDEEDNPNLLTDWEHLLLSSSPPPPPSPPPTTYISGDPFLSIFPPVNHEGLPVANSHHHPPSASTAISPAVATTTSSPSPTPHSRTGDPTIHQHSLYSRPHSPISPLSRWISFALHLLNSKFVSAFSSVRSRVLLLSVPSELTVGAFLMGLGVWMWWRRRRRRPRGSRDDTIEHLNILIREKDEKIIQLLNQVAQLNKRLLDRYRVPVVREC